MPTQRRYRKAPVCFQAAAFRLVAAIGWPWPRTTVREAAITNITAFAPHFALWLNLVPFLLIGSTFAQETPRPLVLCSTTQVADFAQRCG